MGKSRHSGVFARFRNGIGSATANGDIVSPGDRFFSVNCPTVVWQVERVFKPKGLKIRHAEISTVSRGERRVLSETTLLDRQHYEPDQRKPHAINQTAYKRRRRDRLPQQSQIAAGE